MEMLLGMRDAGCGMRGREAGAGIGHGAVGDEAVGVCRAFAAGAAPPTLGRRTRGSRAP